MAKIKLNPIIEQIRGAIGDLVFRRFFGRTIVMRKPEPSEHGPTEAQLAQREAFRQATRYGRLAMEDPELRQFYAEVAAQRQVPLFSMPVADYFNPPVIADLDVSQYDGAEGDTIAVTATDDFGVIAVDVTITDPMGTVLEAGEAELEGHRWIYTAQLDLEPGTAVTVRAEAFDRPGNVTEETVEVNL